jgi:hypothetical protein
LSGATIGPFSYIIQTPPKVWRPRPKNVYVPTEDYGSEFDDDLFLFPRFGKSLRKPEGLRDIPARSDIRLWNPAVDQDEFDKMITIPASLDPYLRNELVAVIQDNWDCFFSDGVRRPILGFEFCIDTGNSAPVSCGQVNYGIHESKIMMEHINTLLHNDWIRPCGGSWCSKIVLAPKPHQEDVEDIADFVWRFCVNYRPLNQVTKPYSYPIARCDAAIDNFGDASGPLHFISVDDNTGYHQLPVCAADQEKLAFAAPDLRKYCYKVMPFGPMNAPATYTAMKQVIKQEADALFAQRFPEFSAVGCKQIIDDSILWSVKAIMVIHYF